MQFTQKTLSDIIHYVYGSQDVSRMNAFNQANKEILSFLRLKGENRKLAKIFDYVINCKLDTEEIIALDPNEFPSPKEVTAAFQKLKTQAFSEKMDSIYRSKRLWLPKVSTWIASDLNKGPSDRGMLKPEPPEYGNVDGNLGKIKYDAYGEKTYAPLMEMRLFIRKIMSEMIF